MNRRDAMFLQEMGLGPRWTMRDAPANPPAPAAEPPASADLAAASSSGIVIAGAILTESVITIIAAPPVTVKTSSEAWPTEPNEQQPAAISDMNWPQLEHSIATCRKCPRCETRRHAVAGVGDTRAGWLFVSDVPELDEALHAAPLAGASKSLFDNMVQAIGLTANADVYLTTLVKCRATAGEGPDRPPTAGEIAACRPYLVRQISLLRPSMLVTLGAAAGATLLERELDTPLSALRGSLQRHGELPLVLTHDPRSLLRHPADKREAWTDLCLARDTHAARI